MFLPPRSFVREVIWSLSNPNYPTCHPKPILTVIYLSYTILTIVKAILAAVLIYPSSMMVSSVSRLFLAVVVIMWSSALMAEVVEPSPGQVLCKDSLAHTSGL